jgi:undecaprenyl diphosphate synthase
MSDSTAPAARDSALEALGLPRAALPRHVAIIMDGNGRWAVQRGKQRMFGHERGARCVRPLVVECAKLGIEALTLYSFSMENWKRPREEIDFLMNLYTRYLQEERAEMMRNNVRFRQLGRRDGLPASVLEQLDRTMEETAANSGLTLALALNYGGRDEITDAVRAIAAAARAGTLDPDAISPETITDHLYTAGLPDPDLLIRTANERRVSNFLLWQISYAEIWVTPTLWPDFDVAHLHEAMRDFAARQRRFGAVDRAPEPPT